MIQKHQKIEHAEKQRVTPPAFAERSRKTALFARSLRALAQVSSLFPLFSQCIPASRRPAKIHVRKIRSSAKTRRAAPAAAPCGGLHRPAGGVRRILRRPRTEKRQSVKTTDLPCNIATPRRLAAEASRGGPQYASYAGIDPQIEQFCGDPAAPCGKTNSRSRTGRTAATGKEILPQCYFTNRRVRISENKCVHLRDATGVAAQDAAAGRGRRAPADSAASGSGRLRCRLETRI